MKMFATDKEMLRLFGNQLEMMVSELSSIENMPEVSQVIGLLHFAKELLFKTYGKAQSLQITPTMGKFLAKESILANVAKFLDNNNS